MIDLARVLDQQLAERYLAGQLTAEERQEFEEAMLEHPEVLEQVELGRTVRLGLQTLRDRGELDEMLEKRPGKSQWWFAAAAAVVICATGLFWLAASQPRVILATSLNELTTRAGNGLNVSEYLLARTRGSEVVALEVSNAEPVIALRVLVPASRQGKKQVVELLRNGGMISSLEALPAGDQLSVYLDASRLETGDYLLRIQSADGSSAATAYPLHLVRRAP